MSDEAPVKLVIFTDSVTVFASDAQVGRATIDAVAKSLELRVDEVVEERRVLSTKFVVTLTGTGEQIESFLEGMEGDGWTSGGGLIDQLVINPLLGAAQRSLSRRWRKRAPRDWGAKPTAVPEPGSESAAGPQHGGPKE
jgi:hypothetical protein